MEVFPSPRVWIGESDEGRTSVKKLLLPATIAIAAGVLIGAGPARIAATTHTVSVRDDSYSRSSITLPRGDKITWKWRGTDDRHNVTSGSSNPVAFKSKTEDGSYSYSHRFSKTGTYTIYCSVHPSLMRLKVKVKRG